MASTAGRSTYDSDSRPRRPGPQQDQEEDWSDTPSDNQTKQTKSPKRQSRHRHKPAEHYRQHTSEAASQFPDDSYIKQARNATVPYGGGYNYNPRYTPSYQAHSNPPLQQFTSPASQGSAGYPTSYAYPGQSSYLSVPRTENAFEQPFGPTPYRHPPGGYSETSYGFDNYNYNQDIPPAPEYPYQDPLRTPVRPGESQTPVSQPQINSSNKYRDEVERKPRKTRSRKPPRSKKEEKTTQPKTEETPQADKDTKADMMEMLMKFLQDGKLPLMKGEERSALPKTEETVPDDKITKADIMELLMKILHGRRPPLLEEEETLPEDKNTNAEIIKILKSIQQGVKENAEIRSDPGRRVYRSPTASELLIDDTTSLGNERHDTRQLKSIIRYLLEDNRDCQSSYTGIPRRGFADHRQNRIEMDYGETALMTPRDVQNHTRVDFLYDYLGIGNSSSPQQLPEAYNNRHGSRVSRRQEFSEPPSPTTSLPRSRRDEYLPPAGNQWQDTPASNQSRYRQQPSRIPEEQEEEYYEEYEVPRVPLRGPVQGRHPGSNTSIGSQGRGRSQPSVGQRSEFRGRGRGIVPGDQQKVGPGRGPILQPESEFESEGELIMERDRAPYRHTRPRAPEPPQRWDRGNHVGFR
ncbi:uncharacterized protein B0J16DRAFT_375022 [Fusarium flagelliforme]|uniref:Uncharacterized protein n=1 Tax=Fusarium flagelliforme TaxID=2675880 RepID=A0A395MF27_9HYPO|nr:uncharacterized protein B0J16DRAFT_375022 [Fusarium flagelliforme]KAH7180098.1 hypothetical protein B0J16DRAFT_375022 [Fusarium flagelliforme]RFN46466.1 hypothetical protein FIE12Z_9301 [Fusarium flagelliforme]